MTQSGTNGAVTADTSEGPIDYVDRGTGPAVLFVHGSPGGSDQGVLMTEFLVAAGFRVVTPSRPGYLGTPLTGDHVGPDQQAHLEAALMEALGIDRFGVMCWSGGGPSTYRLAVDHPDRVSALVAIAAVSKAYTFAGGIEATMMSGRLGAWLVKEMGKHVAQVAGEVHDRRGGRPLQGGAEGAHRGDLGRRDQARLRAGPGRHRHLPGTEGGAATTTTPSSRPSTTCSSPWSRRRPSWCTARSTPTSRPTTASTPSVPSPEPRSSGSTAAPTSRPGPTPPPTISTSGSPRSSGADGRRPPARR